MTDNELVSQFQQALKESGIGAWLFYDFHGLDPIARHILKFGPRYHATRRWFYLVPQQGEPQRLVNRIEPGQLDHLPGRLRSYSTWQELQAQLREMLSGLPQAAMQYSALNAIPYISRIDAGTVELVRSMGPEVVSSADLVQRFECVWSPQQLESHRRAAELITAIVKEAFEAAGKDVREKGTSSEFEVQQFILSRFAQEELQCDSPPIVAINENSSNPHYSPTRQMTRSIKKGDFLLIDLWAKLRQAESVYADITWVAWLGQEAPEKVQHVFEIVSRARDRGVDFLREAFSRGEAVEGWQVDDAVRAVVRESGYGSFFFHRTGHNLGEEVHGNGVNFDNFESHDVRKVIPGIACSVEPGIYLEEFGVRSEIDVYLGPDGPQIATPPQEKLVLIPC